MPAEKFSGLTVAEKRSRPLSARLWSHVLARAPGARSRFRRALASAAAAAPSDAIGYAIPYALARRALGEAAVIEADPRRIDRWVLSEAKSARGVEAPRDYFVIDGPWEALVHPLQHSNLDAEVRELVACGGDYRRTGVFRDFTRRLREEGPFTSNDVLFRAPADIDAYLRYHAGLIESIARFGVVRRSRLRGVARHARRSASNAAFLELVETDAGVAVGPEGALLRYRGGFHRTAAARELGLARMPVEVKLVHLDWLRRVMRETGLPAHDALLAGLGRLDIGG